MYWATWQFLPMLCWYDCINNLINMNNSLQTLRACLSGLIAAQVIATVQVYLSNRALYQTAKALLEAGYLAVPNALVLPSLLKFGTAVIGGLFFTLSVGAGLTLLSLAGVWFWVRILKCSRIMLILIFIAWLVLPLVVGADDSDILVMLYFIIIPPVVFIAALNFSKPTLEPKSTLTAYLPGIALFCIVLTWLPLKKDTLFIDIRDYLLLSNPIGRKINDAYYRYTLYPAQVFKTLEQKTIKTVDLTQINKKSLKTGLVNEFLKFDYVPVSDPLVADLHIRASATELLFQHKNKDILTIPLQDFMNQPARTLEKISVLTDRFAFFRMFIAIGVLIAFPVILYTVFQGLLFLAGSLFLPPKQAFLLATLAVFLAGMLPAWPLYLGKTGNTDESEVEMALTSDLWQKRVSGLRAMANTGKNPAGLPDSTASKISPHIPERYWYVKAVGNSPDGRPQELINFLDDSSVNVACMAYEGLGKTGDSHLIEPILTRLKEEDHWYIQWYAYRALRRIGWSQERLEE